MSSSCGYKEVRIINDILILLIPTPLVTALFCSSVFNNICMFI